MMAYQNNFVVSILNNSRAVREFSENGDRTCILPFGTEYIIRLKNKTYNRAKVKVFIDGMDVLSNGGYFILHPYETLDLERFVDDLKEGKRFKFVSLEQGIKTGEVQDPTSSENGVVRVEFHPEYIVPTTYIFNGSNGITKCGSSTQTTWINSCNTLTNGGQLSANSSINTLSDSITKCSDTLTSGNLNQAAFACSAVDVANNCNVQYSSAVIQEQTKSVPASTKGATATGSDSKQSFQLTNDYFPTSAATYLTIKLRGPASTETVVEKKVWQLVMVNGRPHTVKVNGTYFTSVSDGSKISITNEGLSIEGTGINIKTTEYTISG